MVCVRCRPNLPTYQITHLPIVFTRPVPPRPIPRGLRGRVPKSASCSGLPCHRPWRLWWHAPASAYVLYSQRAGPVGEHGVGSGGESIAFRLQPQQRANSHHGRSSSPSLGAGGGWILHRKTRLRALVPRKDLGQAIAEEDGGLKD